MKTYSIYFILILGLINSQAVLAQKDFFFKVTMIGTGVPPNDGKAASSILVEVGSQKLIFDVGRGASVNIAKYGIALADITNVFITHLHGDHVLGLPDLWLSSYHVSNGKRQGSMNIHGPIGTEKMTKGLEDAYEYVVQNWASYSNPGFNVNEFSSDGIVFQTEDLKVTAFAVEHGKRENWNPVGYRIDYKGRSIIISGDTGYSDNLIEYSKGTDILFHEVFLITDESGWNKKFLSHLKTVHTVPEMASKVFEQVQPKLAVAYHHGADLDKKLEKTLLSEKFKGDIVIAEDLMSFEIDSNGEITKIDN